MAITTQKKLAEEVGVTQVHLSNILSPRVKAGFSVELATRLEKVTGIDALTWATGRRQTVKRLLREFFNKQRIIGHETARGAQR